MPVAEAQERISHAEFEMWKLWFARRGELQERARKGLPPLCEDDGEEMTAQETVDHFKALFGAG